MRRRLWRGLLVAALAGARASTDAAAAEPDYSGPSVCAPPCPEGELCVGNRCVRPAEQSPATSPLPRDRPPPQQPAPPPGSAPTTGPQPAEAPDVGHSPSPGDSHPPPVPSAPPPSAPPPLGHDRDPWAGNTYTLTNTRVKRGFLALPFVGIHSYAQEEASAYSPGVRFGSVLGGRVTQRLSLNGEVIVDISNVHGAPAGFSERAYHFVFSPLLDVAAGPVQLVFGPKLGIFFLSTEQNGGKVIVTTHLTGFSAGLNGGLFLPVSPHTSIGVLLSFDFAGANQSCGVISSGQGPALLNPCGSEAAHGGKVLGLTGGVLF